jgi:YggT family protein
MGAIAANLWLLFDAASSANRFIDDFIWVYIILVFAYILTSWVRLPYTPWVRRIQDFLRDVCEPYLRLFRRVIPPLGPLDLSPMVGTIVLLLLMNIVDRIFSHFT